MTRAAYSGTPLLQKLGIKEGHRVALVGAPSDFDLGILQRGLRGKTPLKILVVFVKQRADLVAQVDVCRPRMQPDAGLWIA